MQKYIKLNLLDHSNKLRIQEIHKKEQLAFFLSPTNP